MAANAARASSFTLASALHLLSVATTVPQFSPFGYRCVMVGATAPRVSFERARDIKALDSAHDLQRRSARIFGALASGERDFDGG
jgi:hypothetical protein